MSKVSVELIGPLRYHAVVIDGRRVPYLTASPRPGDIVELQLDDRLSIDVPVADLDRVARFVADALAIGLGYTSHPGADQEPIPRPPFTRWWAAPANESQTAERLHLAAENETPPAGEIKVCYACYEGDCEYDDCPTWCQCDHYPASDTAAPAEETR